MAWTDPVNKLNGQLLTAADVNVIQASITHLKVPPTNFATTSTAHSSTATVFAQISASLNVSITTEGTSSNVLMMFHAFIANTVTTTAFVGFKVDGALTGRYLYLGGGVPLVAAGYHVCFFDVFYGLAAGSHTFSPNWQTSAGTISILSGTTAMTQVCTI